MSHVFTLLGVALLGTILKEVYLPIQAADIPQKRKTKSGLPLSSEHEFGVQIYIQWTVYIWNNIFFLNARTRPFSAFGMKDIQHVS